MFPDRGTATSPVRLALVRPTPEGVAVLIERSTGRGADLAKIRAGLAALPARPSA